MQLEEIFTSTTTREQFLESKGSAEIESSKVVLLPEMKQGWVAWIESCAAHPESAGDYARFAKLQKEKVRLRSISFLSQCLQFGWELPAYGDYPYNAYVRTFGHMEDPIFFAPACMRWFYPQPLAYQNEAERYE